LFVTVTESNEKVGWVNPPQINSIRYICVVYHEYASIHPPARVGPYGVLAPPFRFCSEAGMTVDGTGRERCVSRTVAGSGRGEKRVIGAVGVVYLGEVWTRGDEGSKGRYSVPVRKVTGVVAIGSRRGQDLLGPPLGGGSCDVTPLGASSQGLWPDRGGKSRGSSSLPSGGERPSPLLIRNLTLLLEFRNFE